MRLFRPKPKTTSVRILVIEDSEVDRKVAGKAIELGGDTALTANDGTTGLAMAKEYLPDLIILDLRLPLMSGQEICKRIKGDKDYSWIPVILLTASSGVITPENMVELKANDLLMKPFNSDELLAKVNKFLGI